MGLTVCEADITTLAVQTVHDAPWAPEEVVFCTFGAAMTRAYEAALADALRG